MEPITYENTTGADSDEYESGEETDIDEPLFARVSSEDEWDMEIRAKEIMDEYVRENTLTLSSPDFYTKLSQYVADELFVEWNNICDDTDYDDIVEWVHALQSEYWDMCSEIPAREEPSVPETSLSSTETAQRLARILELPPEKQRTIEWYQTRQERLTASNLWKAFGSPAQVNSLICEKCRPFDPAGMEKRGMNLTSDNPMQWGIRYEPLSIRIYESRYGTRIRDVGCITHPQYPYIGASPDGINADPAYARYGRMIEVKNIVNREITGVPLEAYWVQMQIQMEVCDLEECDFIETRFQEIDGDPGADPVEGDPGGEKGMILYFIPRITVRTYREVDPPESDSPESNPPEVDPEAEEEYVYLPLDIDPFSDSAKEWVQQEKRRRPHQVLYKTSYWRLDQFSCVLVRRNREWFASAQPKIAEIWKTITVERETGYEHRVSTIKKKRVQTEVVCSENTTTHYIKNMPISHPICLVKLDA